MSLFPTAPSIKFKQTNDFQKLHAEYAEVFNGESLVCYNGASDPLKININMGPMLPPPRKGRVPQYNRNQLEELQKVCVMNWKELSY